MKCRRSQPHSFEDRIAAEKKRLEEQAALLSRGTERDQLERQIRRLEPASRITGRGPLSSVVIKDQPNPTHDDDGQL
jgi:hypothetical protein